LTRALLEQEPSSAAYLSVNPAGYPAFLLALSDTDPQASSNFDSISDGLSILQSLDAESTADAVVDWARVGPHFAQFLETCWNSREDMKIEALMCLKPDLTPEGWRAAVQRAASRSNAGASPRNFQ
jgi:hypothetical protein